MGRLNLTCNAMDKTFESRQNKRMIREVNNQVFALCPTRNLKCIRCELESKQKKDNKGMVMQSFLYVILKAICTFLNQLFKRGDTCNSPQVKKLLC